MVRSASFYGGRSIRIINFNSSSVTGHFIKVNFNIKVMSFSLPEVVHIISTIDDLLYMSEPPSKIQVSTGCEVEEEVDVENTEVFMKLSFSLKNGNVEIDIYDSIGSFVYLDRNGETLKDISFDDNSVAETEGSFKKALKQIRAFDSQYTCQLKDTHIPIDRASFGLVEVN